MVITILDSSLHTQMYFFLWNLSLLDICYSSVAVPKMLMHFFHFFGSTEAVLLTAMSYDRYVAIGNPLRYSLIMNTKVCLTLALGSWGDWIFHSLLHTVLTARLPFCGPNCHSVLLTLLSYIFISKFLVKIRTAEGRKTCILHLSRSPTVVFLQLGTATFNYMRPSTQDSLDNDRAAAVLFTVVTPALNPMIYALRNKDMKRAINKAIKRMVIH
ncbi:hypothetical protein FKM82_015953 [Ascaphus truei]